MAGSTRSVNEEVGVWDKILTSAPSSESYRVVPLHVGLVDALDAEVALVDLEPDGVLALAPLLPLHQRDDHRAARLVVVRVRI